MSLFVVPPLDGPTTGGTRYNRGLIAALRHAGAPVEVQSVEGALAALPRLDVQRVWVDSLWLSAVPELARRAAPSTRVGLLTHYLPTLVSHGPRPPWSGLTDDERAALEAAAGFLVPSEYLAAELVALGVTAERIRVLEPGVERPRPPAPPPALGERIRAVLVANVTEGKGIVPLLDALAERLRADDPLTLTVIGSLDMERPYAALCEARIAGHARLREVVQLSGACEYAECIEHLQQAHMLVSASRMESYGMALADARACGRPILARAGGNVEAHVRPQWGGQLVADEASLATALVELVRDRAELRARSQRAWDRREGRSWADRIGPLLSAPADWPPPRPPQ